MRNATPVLPFKMRRPTCRHYFLRVNFRSLSFFTRTMRAKINPGCGVHSHHSGHVELIGRLFYVSLQLIGVDPYRYITLSVHTISVHNF